MYYTNAKHERQVVNQLIDLYDQDDSYYNPSTDTKRMAFNNFYSEEAIYYSESPQLKQQNDTPIRTPQKTQFTVNTIGKIERTISQKETLPKGRKQQDFIFFSKKSQANSILSQDKDSNQPSSGYKSIYPKLQRCEYLSDFFSQQQQLVESIIQAKNLMIPLNKLKGIVKTQSTERKAIDYKKIQVVQKPMLELGNSRNLLHSTKMNQKLQNYIKKDQTLNQFVCQPSFFDRIMRKKSQHKLINPKNSKNQTIIVQRNQTISMHGNANTNNSIHHNPVLMRTSNQTIKQLLRQFKDTDSSPSYQNVKSLFIDFRNSISNENDHFSEFFPFINF